ncbi:MAG: ABC transporter substrate-binding protein [Anaerolineae bacterium]|nr:ABC transporter substrate-binding protein [Anaerolineae bacterium]
MNRWFIRPHRRHSISMTYVALAGLLISLMLLAACAPAPAAAPSKPSAQKEAKATPAPAAKAETFRIAVGIDPDTLDPALSTTTTVSNIIEYMVETLVVTDKDGNVQPKLATSWEVSDDGLEYTLHLRKGVTFHDGTPMNAEAVKWNLDRMLDPKVKMPMRSTFAAIKKVEAVDEYTIKIYLSQPFAPLISSLSLENAGIISPKSVNMEGNSYESVTRPVGTGPYIFEERVKGERIEITRNPNYWGEKPYYDKVVFRVVPEAATRESLLLAGQVDLIILPPISDLPALQKNSDVKVLLAPSDRTIFIAINTLHKPLDDVRVRQALNYAVDKQEIIKGVLFGAAEPLDAPMAPNLFGYCKLQPYEYNPDKAKALLAEAGVKDLQLNFIAPTGRYVQDFQAAQAISNYLNEIGIKAPVSTMDWPSYVAAIMTPPDKNTIDLHFLGWAPDYLDAAQQMMQFYSPESPPNGLETSFYKNPKVDELIEAAGKETNPDKRKDLYCQASRLIWEDAPWIFLWVQRFPIVYRANIAGVDYHPTEKFSAIYAHPAE